MTGWGVCWDRWMGGVWWGGWIDGWVWRVVG